MILKKTKMVCTMGPATDKPGIIPELIKNGMDVARLNFSHGDHEEHAGRIAHSARSAAIDMQPHGVEPLHDVEPEGVHGLRLPVSPTSWACAY